MRALPSSLVIDTCVWVDNYLGTRPGSGEARSLLDAAIRLDIDLLYAITSAKDVYYLVAQVLKREQTREGVPLTPSLVAANKETAWACVENMERNATAVGLDASDVWLAHKFKPVHDDFEDNLVVAAARRAKADYLVTNDERLLRHSPVAALSPRDMLALLRSLAESRRVV